MDWAKAVEHNRIPLIRIVAALFAMIGLGEGRAVEKLSWPLYRAVLRVLRPAESAVRRLIVVAARGIVVKLAPTRPAPAGLHISGKGGGGVSFKLFDPRKRFDWVNGRRSRGPLAEPRIYVLDVGFDRRFDPRVLLFLRSEPAAAAPAPAPAPEPDNTVSAAPLCRRLAAIKLALEDLPRQARRYARWRSRPLEARRPRVFSALRPGRPPGFRRKPGHEVDAILTECHELAWNVSVPDTS